ncbi:MAG: hypothetical protein CVU27_01170 [Betaproteobacteria bacterium HGW-Betaproteobacteria-20]|jgi:hypothetical protein|nr:MAG: hypothetical protein CVU27_01170 [Betaproteobacteria bacterium HGW-Betaproteobacteria-20]
MNNLQEPFKINLNQNLWGLIISLSALGLAEYHKLCTLFYFAVVISIVMIVSVTITTYAYTAKYYKNKHE